MPERSPGEALAYTVFTGDNLHVLRGINDDSIDLIYLDPPFNSNKSYSAPICGKAAGAAFKDTWTLDDVDLAWHGEIAERESAVYAVIDASDRSHGKGMKSYLIMMAVRLLEMRRALKPLGSIYLHCDAAAGHYLKLLMDGIFGKDCFRNEITWRRYGSHNDARKYGRVSDKILFYAPPKATWNTQRLPLDAATVARNYRHEDERGRFATSPLHARTLSGGGYEYTWRGISDVWKFPKERLDALDADGRIYWPPKGRVPRRKVYLDDASGKPASDVITDISIAAGKERTGYPTQKPLALLERFIGASSNQGDLVLDPFLRLRHGVDRRPQSPPPLDRHRHFPDGPQARKDATRTRSRRVQLGPSTTAPTSLDARISANSRTTERTSIPCTACRRAFALVATSTSRSET